MKPFALVINFSMSRMWGKIGPFRSWKEAHEWCTSFREVAVKEGADMTALTGEQFDEIVRGLCCHDYLPSKDVGEIINNARVTAFIKGL